MIFKFLKIAHRHTYPLQILRKTICESLRGGNELFPTFQAVKTKLVSWPTYCPSQIFHLVLQCPSDKQHIKSIHCCQIIPFATYIPHPHLCKHLSYPAPPLPPLQPRPFYIIQFIDACFVNVPVAIFKKFNVKVNPPTFI